jgi:xanthine dehydrogenase YagR molybdenum-binding subunit
MTPYIGSAISRIDGVAKVTGAAKYAAEHNAPGLAHGSVVCATIAKGRVTRIDTAAAQRLKGVLAVLTHENRPAMADNDQAYKDDTAPEGAPYRPLYDGTIMFDGQPIALVVAETPEIARHAASLVRATYETTPHATDIYSQRDAAMPLRAPTNPFETLFAPPEQRGAPDPALTAAPVRHEAEYYVPIEHHNPMELFASTVILERDRKLTVYEKTQGVQNVQRYLCSVFGLAPENVRVLMPYMGGGFGVGLRPTHQTVLAVLAVQKLRRSVRVMLTRPQMYALGYRPPMIQRIGIGARRSGVLEAMAHDAVTGTSRYEDFHRQETGWSGLLYKCANASYAHRLARLDLPTSCDMRAPSAGPALFALESAMDEVAVALGVDPLEFRLRNYSERDQNADKPYSSKALRACYAQGAAAFGWDRRKHAPRSMRDNGDLVGWGMATGVWEALQIPITVRISLDADGRAEVACATADIGTGTYTIMAQVAADMLGLPLDKVSVKLGDSHLPQSPVQGGSWMATSLCNSIVATADAIRGELARLGAQAPHSPLAGLAGDDVILSDGKIVSRRDSAHFVLIADAMRQGGVERIEQQLLTNPTNDPTHSRNAHSAVFAEVKVDEQIGVVRVTRVVSAVAAGRIINAKTARSQILGGVVWGIGMALHERTIIDHRFGRVMNANIAEYYVPVHADVPADIDVIFVPEEDAGNALGMKGIGEIGLVGVAGAIANAVYHATGKRVRDLPITLDKLARP